MRAITQKYGYPLNKELPSEWTAAPFFIANHSFN